MIKKNNPGIVLFDFDGTLSAGDASSIFPVYCFGHSVRPWLFLPVVLCAGIVQLAAFLSRKISGGNRVRDIDILWRQMMRSFLTPRMVKELGPRFIKLHRQSRFGWAAEQVAKEKAAGNITILTSGGGDYMIVPLASDMNFDYILCSEMDPKHPWKFRFFNYGPNKVASLKALIESRKSKVESRKINIIRAYSDSKSDRPMMSLAREQVWINPKTGTRR